MTESQKHGKMKSQFCCFVSQHGVGMVLSWEADGLVSLRSNNIDRYKRNFLRQAVCELRFPTLLELGDSRPPASLVSALRKEYPHLELANEVTLGIGVANHDSSNTHIFRSAKMTWSVSIKQSALTIETTAYTEYENLKERVLRAVDAASKVIDSDFFTRIGLRYVNVIDTGGDDPADGWINPVLVAPLRAGCFSGVQEYAGKLQLAAIDGGCLLQHGIRIKPQQRPGETIFPEYLLDIDTYRNEVALSDTAKALDLMHAQAFDFFDWAIGEKAREYLSADKTPPKA